MRRTLSACRAGIRAGIALPRHPPVRALFDKLPDPLAASAHVVVAENKGPRSYELFERPQMRLSNPFAKPGQLLQQAPDGQVWLDRT